MPFEIDRQTLADLAIFEAGDSGNTIFNIFKETVTYGGGDQLKYFFDHPLTDPRHIAERLNTIKYLQDVDTGLRYDKGSCDFIEHYLSRGNGPVNISAIRAIEKRIVYLIKGDSEYYITERGIAYTIALLKQLYEFTQNHSSENLPEVLKEFHNIISDTLASDDFKPVHQLFDKAKYSAMDIARMDRLFRYIGSAKLRELIDMVYQLDALTTVAAVSKRCGFSFPVINHNSGQELILHGAFHPLIKKPVVNDVVFSCDKNICFITGTNMAGKSTFLKTVGVAVFLSQIGFPVPAERMETSGFKGLITTINLADNLSQGSSHFYNEVLRVKYVARKMSESQQLLVIFDELFRGTNVKDAYDASLAIISAFAKVRQSFFIISTHIVEVANDLAGIANIDFKFMETIFTDDQPKYSYRLRNGITEERLGMWIVQNDGIVDMIEELIVKGAESRKTKA